jgi:hypothetical protein
MIQEESSLWRKPMSDSKWQELIADLKSSMAMLDQGSVQPIAKRICHAVQWLDLIMAKYCAITCSSCDDPCCGAEAVFYNRTDMLSLLAMGIAPSPGQTRTSPNQPCRYLTPAGCRLPRIARPYVCVWFLCQAQMELFQSESGSTPREFIRSLESIRADRMRLESLYEIRFPKLA